MANASGGGIFILGTSDVLIRDSKILGNLSNDNIPGGGVKNSDSKLNLVNVLIANNMTETSDRAGGIFTSGPSSILNLLFVTITNNEHHGLYSAGGLVNIKNSIIFNNGTEIYDYSSEPFYDVSYSLVFGGFPGIGNIDFNPLFIDEEMNNYKLKNNSQCIGSGIIIDSINSDIEGNPRPYPEGSNPDIGAYENSLAEPEGALNITFVSANHISCFGDENGSMDMTVTGGTEPYTYNWTSTWNDFINPNTEDLVNLGAGDYSLSITDANSEVTSSGSHTITQPDNIEFTFDVFHVLCFGHSTGNIEITATGGTGPYQYSIDNGTSYQASNVFSNLAAAPYNLKVIDNNDCESITQTVSITQPSSITQITLDQIMNVDCNSTGSIEITVNQGTAPFAYSWTGPAGYTSTDEDISTLIAGNYSLSVTDANNCEVSAGPFEVEQYDVAFDGVNHISCFGDNNGSMNMTVTSGTEPYTYNWTSTWINFVDPNTEDLANLGAGNYTLTVTDANNCVTYSGLHAIIEPDNIEFTFDVTHVLCFGYSTGNIEITVTGGTVPYQYSIDNGTSYQTSNVFNNLATDSYQLKIKDANDCESMIQSTSINQPSSLAQITLDQIIHVDCNSTGSINVTVNQGTAPYTYSWTGPNGYTSSNEDISTLIAGNYSLSVTDANNCEVSAGPFEVEQPDAALNVTLDGTNHITCFGDDANGSIDMTVTGGTEPYTYNWTSTWNNFVDPNTEDLANLDAGDYNLTVTDNNNCVTSSGPHTITEPDNIEFTFDVSHVLCFGYSTGNIEITVTGGTVPYQYSIDNGTSYQASNVFDNLDSGSYQLKVKDANDCESMIQLVSITQPSSLPQIILDQINNVNCNSNSTGSIHVTIDQGTAPYTYSWTGPSGYTSSNEDISTLIAGNYSLSVTDANNCEVSIGPFEVEQPDAALDITLDGTNHITCFGDDANGSIDMTVTGGTEPYTYNWTSTWNNFVDPNTEDLANLDAGDYNLTVTDDNNCVTSSGPHTITEPDNIEFTFDVSHVLCFGNSTGNIEITVTGGTVPYQYSIDNGTSYQASNVFDNLDSGSYQLKVKDANDCESMIQSVSINQPSSLPQIILDQINNVNCNSNATGSIHVTTDQGTAPYTYSWTGPSGYTSSNEDISTLIAGNYSLSVSDANNCEVSIGPFEVEQPDAALEIVLDGANHINCFGDDADGSMDMTVTGGTEPYTYNWTSTWNDFVDPNTEDLANLGAGNYNLTVTDVNNCVASSGPHIITEPDNIEFTFDITHALCFGYSTGIIEITAIGGIAPYQYSIDNGQNYQESNIFEGLFASDYNIFVMDNNECIRDEIVSVLEPNSALSFTEEIVDVLCFEGVSGQINIQANGGISPYEYSKDGGINYQSSSFFDNLEAGEYNLSVRDANNCEIIGLATVTEPDALPIVFFDGLEVGYCIYSESIILSGNQAPEGNFEGSGITDNGDGTAWFSPQDAGEGLQDISYHYTSPEECYNSQIQSTQINATTDISIIDLDEYYCLNAGSILITGSEAPSGNFSGIGITDNTDGTAYFNPEEASIGGPYSITYSFTDGNGCYAELEDLTEVLDIPIAMFVGLEESYCIDNDPVQLTSNHHQGLYSGPGVIDAEDGTAIFNPSVAGTGMHQIQYEYTDPNGCTAIDLQTIEVFGYVDLSFTGLASSYCSNGEAVTLIGSEAPLGVFSGPGILDSGDGTAIFTPSSLNAGNIFNIAYTINEIGQCETEYHQEVSILEIAVINFDGLNAFYCIKDESYLLTGSMAPEGSFIGEGIEDLNNGTAKFNLGSVIIGQETEISYSYEKTNGCLSNTSQLTIKKEDPIANFEFILYNCNDEAIFMDQSYSENGEIINWNWNFDDPYSGDNNTSMIQNPIHEFINNYSVFDVYLQVEDETGCFGSITKEIYPYSGVSIKGNVSKSDGEPITNGYVVAFYLSDGILSVFADLAPIQENGDYEFLEMSSCVEYLLHAIPNRLDYPFVFPRWYDDAFYWTDATAIFASYGNETIENIDFNLEFHEPSPSGPSSLSGGVYYFNGTGDPVQNVDVVLESYEANDKFEVISDYRYTDNSGLWEFENLPRGEYKISVDIPGLRMDTTYSISISESETHISDLNYYVDTLSGIYIIISGTEEINQQIFGQIDIFPNPNSGLFSLEVSKLEGQVQIEDIEIWDIEGRFIRKIPTNYKGIKYKTVLDLSGIQSGVYLIKLKAKGEIGLRKFVIQK